MGKCLSRNTEVLENRFQPEKSTVSQAEKREDQLQSNLEVKTFQGKRIQVNQNICHDIVLYSAPKPNSRNGDSREKSKTETTYRPNVSPLNLSSVISDDDSDVSDINESITVVLASAAQSKYTENKLDPSPIADSKDLNTKRIEWNNRYILSAIVAKDESDKNAYSKYMGTSFIHQEDLTSRNTEKTSNKQNLRPLKDETSYNGQNIHRDLSLARENYNVHYELSHATETPSKNQQTTVPETNYKVEANKSIEPKSSVLSDTDARNSKTIPIVGILDKKNAQEEIHIDTDRKSSSPYRTNENQNKEWNEINEKLPCIGVKARKDENVPSGTDRPSFLQTIENANDAITRLRCTDFRRASSKGRSTTVPDSQQPSSLSQKTENKTFTLRDLKTELVVDIRHNDEGTKRSYSTTSQNLNPELLVHNKPKVKAGLMDTRLNIRTTQSTTSNYTTVRQASDAIARLRSLSRGRSKYWEPSICSDLSETFSWNEDPKDSMLHNLQKHEEEVEGDDKENSPRKTPFSPDYKSVQTMSTLSFTITK